MPVRDTGRKTKKAPCGWTLTASPVLASMQRRKDTDRKRNKWVCLRVFYLLIASISGVDKHVQAEH